MCGGRALYLEGCGAHLIMAAWSGILSLSKVILVPI